MPPRGLSLPADRGFRHVGGRIAQHTFCAGMEYLNDASKGVGGKEIALH